MQHQKQIAVIVIIVIVIVIVIIIVIITVFAYLELSTAVISLRWFVCPTDAGPMFDFMEALVVYEGQLHALSGLHI